MLKPKQMSKVLLIGHKDLLEPTIETLHNLRMLHIEEYTTEDYFRIGKPLQGVEQDSKKLVKLRSIATFLGIAKPYIKPIDAEQVSSELEEKLEALDRVVSEKLKRKSDIDVKLKDVETTIHEIEPFFGINIDFDLCSGYDSLHVFSGTIKKGTDIETELKGITSEYQLFVSSTGVIILFIPVKYKDRVANLLTEYEFNEVKIPAISGIPDTLLRELKNQHDSLTEDIGLLSSEIDSIKVQYEDFILAGEELLSIETQKKEAPLFFATSDHTFAIDGWVPDDEFETVKSRIEAATDSRVHVTRLEEEIDDDADIPIEYENPKIVKPLEAVMDLYARPTYHEIDPTAIIFITFPLFYGLILGDVGYALILLGLSYYGRSKLHGEGWNSLFTLLIYCNIYTLFFGILYGEFLGFPLASHEGHSGLIPWWHTIELFNGIGGDIVTFPIHRMHLVTTLLILSIIIGVIHINLGLIAGFVNVLNKHGMKAAILEKISWMVLQLGAFLLLFGMMGIIPTPIPGAGILIISIAMLIAGEGATAIIEIPSILSNILSYSRLLAVGLSSIGIASAVNTMSGMLMESGGLFIIFAVVVFIFGHTINTALSIIAPGLHALRLQYVEFFTKFYEGGGRIYNPFGYKRIYTEE